MKTYRIAVIPGDGIGKEVVPEGIRVLDAVAKHAGIRFEWEHFDWSCERYAETGTMMPDDGLAQIRNHDAIFLGACGFPNVPDHVSLWGLLIPIRRQFVQYANVRPVRLMPGIASPLAGRESGDIDMIIVRELTAVNVRESDARDVADVLVAADLRGVESHGIARLETFYVRRIEAGVMPFSVL